MGRVEPDLEREAYVEGRPVPKLAQAQSLRVGLLRLTWTDGVSRDVDVGHLFDHSRALARMLSIPEVWSDFEIEEGGHGLRWINGVDLCSDALRLRGDAQAAEKET
ncbi:MAG: DUF2442 domain-containing protein [Shimia sp.]